MRWWHGLMVVAVLGWWLVGRPVRMPAHELVRYDAQQSQASQPSRIGPGCMKERCLLVYVAPWCPHCRQAHGAIVAAAAELEAQGVPTTVVMGMDKRAALEAYAADFPFPVYFDHHNQFFKGLKGSGVPYFVVWDGSGKVVATTAGGYSSSQQLRNALQLP